MEAIRAVGGVNTGKQLTPQELAEVARLAARDRDVRAHEAQHLAAAGSMANGVEYTYEMGPDGKMYAVGGKVNITIPAGQSPEQALATARQLRAAANAPSDPSGQDMVVAAQASQMEADALQKIAKEHAKSGNGKPDSPPQHSFRGLDRMA
jgi:hypothetical protein